MLIAGGTGFIGAALVCALRQAADEPVVLTRHPRERGQLGWDGETVGDWAKALEGAEAVINLAGESVAAGRWTRARKARIAASRLHATRALVAALAAAKKRPKTFLSASAVGFYGPRGDEALDESAGPGTGYLAGLCADWEEEARRAQDLGVRTVALRFGVVLAEEGGALPKMLLPFKLGLGGPLGSGRQWMSWISRADAVGMIQWLLKSDLGGPVNITAPEPATNADFARALAATLHRPAVLPAPAFALRLLLGEMADELLLSGQRVLPKKALSAGYSFRHKDLSAALQSVLS